MSLVGLRDPLNSNISDGNGFMFLEPPLVGQRLKSGDSAEFPANFQG